MGPMTWTGLRQLEAIRDSVNQSLRGYAIPPGPPDHVLRWLHEQGIQDIRREMPEAMISFALTDGFKQGFGQYPDVLCRGSDAPDPRLVDYGAERSGAGWQNPANFVITSAFVRLLGAHEQFEMDVLKALFYYRPSGLLGADDDQMLLEAEADVMLEEPVIRGDNREYKKPVVWTWLRKYAENNIERSRIFKNVFGISTVPDGCKPKQKTEWYDKRNAIAHGRAGVLMTLAEYIEVDVFLAKSMLFIHEQCREKMKLVV